VTTGSLGALRSYAAGLRANDIQADYPAAIQDFHEAIRQDSTFAMAYVQLAYSLQTLGGPGSTAAITAAMTEAFRLRERLPDRERYNVEGGYYMTAAPNRPQAIRALRRAVELDSTNYDAANSLGVVLGDAREGAAADTMFRLALEGQPDNGTILSNLATQHAVDGQYAAFDSVFAEITRRDASYPTSALRFGELWARHDYDERNEWLAWTWIPRSRATPSTHRARSARLALLRGRLREGERRFAQMVDLESASDGDTMSPYEVAAFYATVDGGLRGDVPRARAILDSTLRAKPPAAEPSARP